MREDLVLAHERRRDVLRDHEAGVEPAVPGQERGQAVGEAWVHEALDAPLGDVGELRDRHRQRVQSECQRLPVEVAVRNEQLVFDEDERVVRRGVELRGNGVARVVEEIARGAVNLRRAPQRVGVLHLVAPAVSLVDRRVLEQPEHVRGGIDLPPERPRRVNLRQEARARALERFQRDRAGDVGRLREPIRPRQAQRAERGHELRPVHQRQPLLRLQANRLQPGRLERLSAGQDPAVEPRFTLTYQRKREVG